MAMTKSPTSSASEIAHLERRKTVAALEAQHGEVGARIAQHDLGLELAPVAERHPHFGRVLDDVKVGDDEARRVDEDAGAERLLHPVALVPAAAEEALEDRIVEQRVSRHPLDMRDIDVYHRRRDLPDHGRKRQANLRRILRRRLRKRVGEGECGAKGEDDSEQKADQVKTPSGEAAALI